jgi:hypothetical protein
MEHLKFTPANRIEFEVRLNKKGQHQLADAIIEAKEFLKKESLQSCDVWVDDFYAEVERNTDTIQVLREYVQHRNKNREDKISEENYIEKQIAKEYIAILSSIHRPKCIILEHHKLFPCEVWIELIEDCHPYHKGERYVIERNKLI